jgi:hypothetical protein
LGEVRKEGKEIRGMEILEQLKLLKQLFSYGLIGQIVIAIGLLIIFFYQRHKIGSLETQIKAQKGILDSAEAFFDLFDLEKLRGYAEIREEKVRMEKEIEFKRFNEEFKEKVKKEKDAMKYLSGQFVILFNAFLDAFFYVPSGSRSKIIDSMGEGIVKSATKEINRRIEETKGEARLEGLLEAFSKSNLRKGIPERNEKEGKPD